MWFRKLVILFFVLVITSGYAFAQETPAEADSTKLYRNIESYSERGKFTRFLHGLIFKPVAVDSHNDRVYQTLVGKSYSAFEGKTIRNITIETLDPFGYSVSDTIEKQHNFLSHTGNKLHIKSQRLTIRNLLLIRHNQPFDSLRVKESERLVRTRNYIQDVSFSVVLDSTNADSVDIFIRTVDKWSIIPKGSASGSHFRIVLTDKNFLGLGHEYQNDFARNYDEGNSSFHTDYSIPNIKNTYISTTLHYGIEGQKYLSKNLSVDRPFFSPLSKWAAGVNFTQQFRNDSILTHNGDFAPQRYKFNAQDYWAGYAKQIFKGNTLIKRTTNFVSTIRFLRVRYLEKPNEEHDPFHYFANENFYMGSIGISTRIYFQDRFIFRYGLIEDVPVGKVFSLTGGYQKKDDIGRLYLGARISMGKYYPWGYFSSNFEYGSFFKGSHTEQGTINVDLNYFTGLFEIGKLKFRQFVKPQVTIGLNRFITDSLTINDGYGLDGFNSPTLTGDKRFLLTLQTQAYTPWKLIGFHFGPYLICSLGMIGNNETGFRNSRLYSQMGLGVLFRNENLVINTFQISLSFYPSIPGKGQNIFKINSFKTADFGFRDFVIGKPVTARYR
jgi:hypothetical protein